MSASDGDSAGNIGIVSLDTLKTSVKKLHPAVIPSSSHCVLFKLPVVPGVCPDPLPPSDETWKRGHVVMPHSNKNRVKVGENKFCPRWHLIQNALKVQIANSQDLERVIFSYSGLPNQRCQSFRCLHKFFSVVLDAEDTDYFFTTLLPQIIDLALKIEELFPVPCPLLESGNSFSISLTQKQIASIIANSFLCTFPFYQPSGRLSSINCDRLFQTGRVGFQKLKCLINYFRRITTSVADGVVTFSRHCISNSKLPNWSTSTKTPLDISISSEGTIEDDGTGLLEIDFANKYIGGGVLGWGCVQEEIKFLIYPELLASRLFTERMENSEAVIISGCERFNKYTGYADSFKWTGNFEDKTPRDEYGRRCAITVAIDALSFSNKADQFKPTAIARELNKAYTGFSFGLNEGFSTNIATGNWGCGAFNGDPPIKFLIQLIAASQCDRKLAYFTFHEKALMKTLKEMYLSIRNRNLRICDLWEALEGYGDYVQQNGPIDLDEYIFRYSEGDIPRRAQNNNNFFDQDSARAFIEHEGSGENACVPSSSAMITDTNWGIQADYNEEAKAAVADCSFSSWSDSEMMDVSSVPSRESKEPVQAATYSLQSEEGREVCLATEEQQWEACRAMKAKAMSALPDPPPKKKQKISDYFNRTS